MTQNEVYKNMAHKYNVGVRGRIRKVGLTQFKTKIEKLPKTSQDGVIELLSQEKFEKGSKRYILASNLLDYIYGISSKVPNTSMLDTPLTDLEKYRYHQNKQTKTRDFEDYQNI